MAKETKKETLGERIRKWFSPRKRAASYAAERKNSVHMGGPKVGQELTEYEKGLRSGYLLCQSDHAGQYKYQKARNEGKTKEEAAKISRTIGKKN